MARPFLSQFLLPLVKGGALHVGRPIGRRALGRLGPVLLAADTPPDVPVPAADAALASEGERRAAAELRRHRRAQAVSLSPGAGDLPPLDETAIRLGAAVHDLLAMGHPGLGGRGAEARRDRIGAAALELAEIGVPATAADAVSRHSLLARLPEIARSDRTVRFWIGRQTFIGRMPPRRVTALPRLRNVRVELVRRSWLREIGIPASGRAAFLALNVASPLGEALDPLRLDPPLSWSRILPVLRFPALCRVVAGRALEVGARRAGDAFAEALFRFASLQDPPGGMAATPEGVRFAIGFLAHLVWLDVLFPAPPPGAGGEPRAEHGGTAGVGAGGVADLGPDQSPDLGLDLAAIVAAASRVHRDLVWPRDVARGSDVGRAFAARVAAMAGDVAQRRPARLEAAAEIAKLAVLAGGSQMASPPSPPA